MGKVAYSCRKRCQNAICSRGMVLLVLGGGVGLVIPGFTSVAGNDRYFGGMTGKLSPPSPRSRSYRPHHPRQAQQQEPEIPLCLGSHSRRTVGRWTTMDEKHPSLFIAKESPGDYPLGSTLSLFLQQTFSVGFVASEVVERAPLSAKRTDAGRRIPTSCAFLTSCVFARPSPIACIDFARCRSFRAVRPFCSIILGARRTGPLTETSLPTCVSRTRLRIAAHGCIIASVLSATLLVLRCLDTWRILDTVGSGCICAG